MESKTIFIWVFAFCLAAIVPSLRAHISNFAEADDYWKAKEEDAKLHALKAYHNNPEDVTDHLNLNVHLALEGMNSTRRELAKRYRGRCIATNPIDRCWRCRSDWAQNRKQLANCALGFGRNTTGGARGRYYVVYDPSDNDMVNPRPGTLRHAVIQKKPMWIIFARSMVISLQQELMINNDKTIDGRGARIQITRGAGLTIQFVKNVIIHNIHISDIVPRNGGMIRDSPDHFGFRTASDGDGISVFGSSRVWLDHISMRSCSDGLIDVVAGSTAVTISNGHYTHHNDVMLFGASNKTDEDKIMQVTVAFNHFGKGLVQRMPRCRWGYFHVVNNDYTHWLLYAIGGSDQPTIISQGNRFIAPSNVYKQVTKRDYAEPSRWNTWVWRTEGDLFMNGAFFIPSGQFDTRKPSRKFIIKPKLATNVNIITRFAGTLSCFPNRPC